MDAVILVAERDPHISHVHRRYLTSCGYRVHCAAMVGECMAKLRDLSPDLLLIDADLPWSGDDGLQLQLGMESRRSSLPPVLLTGCEPGTSVPGLPFPAAVEYLQKPFNLDKVLGAVHRCLSVRPANFGEARRDPPSSAEAGPGPFDRLEQWIRSFRQAPAGIR